MKNALLRKNSVKVEAPWCEFCSAIKETNNIGNTVDFINKIGNQLQTRIVFESEHYSVISSIGSFVEGYLLILTKNHFTSMSHIPLEYFKELDEVETRVKSLTAKYYTQPLFFEHGPMPSSTLTCPAEGGGSCVDHAHFHSLPLSISFSNDLLAHLKSKFPYKMLNSLNELSKQSEMQIPYFYVRHPCGERFIFDVENTVASQYIRRYIANSLGVSDRWNWRVHPEVENVIKTVKKLSDN